MKRITDDSHLRDGAAAETLAQHYLEARGLQLWMKNYRCKLGEIDLIMREQNTLVFVEVRLRSNPFFSSAAESVTHTKQQKLIRTAQRFLQEHKLVNKQACRFDIIALSARGESAIEWIRDAFGAG